MKECPFLSDTIVVRRRCLNSLEWNELGMFVGGKIRIIEVQKIDKDDHEERMKWRTLFNDYKWQHGLWMCFLWPLPVVERSFRCALNGSKRTNSPRTLKTPECKL